MGRIATTIEEQIELLKVRGMSFAEIEEDKAKEILLDIGYYRLGFYWYPFEKDNNHNFKEGTCFSDVVSLYYLDVDLRNILLKYLKRIEVNFRTKLVYYLSNEHNTDAVWFTNPKIMHNWYIDGLESLYSEKFKKDNKQIKSHHVKHRNDKYAPAWKTFEFLTFGAVYTIFIAIKNKQSKENIANLYGLNDLKTFENFIRSIKYIRNICAHGGVVFDLNFPKGISKIPKTKFTKNNNQSLDAGIKTMLFILKSISEGRKSDLKQEIDSRLIEEKENLVIKTIIEEKLGYNYN